MSDLTSCKWCRVGAHENCSGADMHGLSDCPCKTHDHRPAVEARAEAWASTTQPEGGGRR